MSPNTGQPCKPSQRPPRVPPHRSTRWVAPANQRTPRGLWLTAPTPAYRARIPRRPREPPCAPRIEPANHVLPRVPALGLWTHAGIPWTAHRAPANTRSPRVPRAGSMGYPVPAPAQSGGAIGLSRVHALPRASLWPARCEPANDRPPRVTPAVHGLPHAPEFAENFRESVFGHPDSEMGK